MSLEHTTRAITENKYSMQLFADKESLKADIATMEKLKASNPSDERVSDYNISQKKYELSQIESRIKGKDYTSVKSQCEQYFADNSTLFDKNQIIAETRSMLNRGQTVNEWPHLAAVFLLDHASVTDVARQNLEAAKPQASKPQASKQDPAPKESLSPGEHLVKPEKQSTKPATTPSAKPQTATTPTVQPKPENSKLVPSTLLKQAKETKEQNNVSVQSVKEAYEDFIAYAQNTDKWLAGLRNSQEDVQNINKNLSAKFEKFNTTVNAYVQSGGKTGDIDWMRLNIAYYYTDDLSGVSSKNQMDIVRSMNISLDILGDKVSRIPSIAQQEDDTMNKIGTENPKLAELISKKIEEQVARNETPNLSAILSNPMVKGSWEKASDEIYGTYLKKLDNELDLLKGQKWDTLSESQKKALNHLRDIRGKDGFFDLTVQNREQMWSMLKGGGAVLAGIAATIPTGGASLGALALGVGVGATVMTAGGILAQGYHGSVTEVAGDAGINLLSFGGGAILFKVASMGKIAKAAQSGLGARAIIYGTESVGNVGIGVSADMFRARLHNEDLDVWSSIQQNLVWAALPFALRMRGIRVPQNVEKDASEVSETLRSANALVALGKSPTTLLEKMKSPLSRLRNWGEKSNVHIKNEMNLDDFKKMHLSGDSLYEKIIKLGAGKRIEIEGLPGYMIGMTENRKMIHIIGPDKVGYKLYKDQLEKNLEECYKRLHTSTISRVKNTDNSTPTTPEAPVQKAVEAPVQRYNQEIEKSLKGLHKDGDSFILGEYTITKEGKKYRIKGPDGEFVGKTQKDVVSKIETYLQKDAKVANEFIDSQVKTHIDSLPIGKKVQYGEVTVTKNKDGSIEVVGRDGKVLSGEDLSAFYQKNAEGLLNTKVKSFLSKHGNEKVDPNKFAEWYGKDRKWYNPVTWGKGVINMTWNEVMQPVQTWNAFLGKGGALRTLDNPLAMTNNIAKAIVLRDVKMNWFSTDSAMRVIGRGTIMTGATVATGNVVFGPNGFTMLGMTPHTIAYSTLSGDTQHTVDEYNKTAFSTYYWGMIWGSILSEMIGGMPNN